MDQFHLTEADVHLRIPVFFGSPLGKRFSAQKHKHHRSKSNPHKTILPICPEDTTMLSTSQHTYAIVPTAIVPLGKGMGQLPQSPTKPSHVLHSKVLSTPASPVDLKTQDHNNKRKRVRWEEDTETRDVKRRVMDLSHLPSSQLSKCEKGDLWLTKQDYEESLATVLEDVVAAKYSGGGCVHSVQSCYTQAMAQTYSLCCSPDSQNSIPIENAALLSLLDSSFRGLESHTLPREMREDRRTRKIKTVKRVLELQGDLRVAGNPNEDASECLRLVSEYFSEPSRKFARALGEIDGTYVYLMEELSSDS
jgi:hypothetical protein